MTNVQIVNSFMNVLNGLKDEDRNGILLSLAGMYAAEKRLNGATEEWIIDQVRGKADEFTDGIQQKIVRIYDHRKDSDRPGAGSSDTGLSPCAQF